MGFPDKQKQNALLIPARWLFAACMTGFPIFALTIARWVNVAIFTAAVVAIFMLLCAPEVKLAQTHRKWVTVLAATLLAPVAAVFLGQLFRQQFSWPDFDSPLRFLLAVPVLLALLRTDLNTARALHLTIPMSVYATWAITAYAPNLYWGEERLATCVADPLNFGRIILSLGLLSLASINWTGIDQWGVKLFKITAFILACYLSVRSGSRTGWMAVPLILMLLVVVKGSKYLHPLFITAFAAATAILAVFLIYHTVDVVHDRLALGVQDITDYRWNEVNPDTSVGLRISFARMGYQLFLMSPLGGWGDKGYFQAINAPEFAAFTSQFGRWGAVMSGFHNEIITNMVRSGVWGLASSAALFLVPLLLFGSRLLRSGKQQIRNTALIGLSYVVIELISAMTTEVFELKYTAALYALMLVNLSAPVVLTES
jgi:O-antigen ligase